MIALYEGQEYSILADISRNDDTFVGIFENVWSCFLFTLFFLLIG